MVLVGYVPLSYMCFYFLKCDFKISLPNAIFQLEINEFVLTYSDISSSSKSPKSPLLILRNLHLNFIQV